MRLPIMRSLIVMASALGAAGFGGGARAETPVDVELVLAVDVSGSMDADEQGLQRAGYVAAFMHEEVLAAIRSGFTGRIAVTYVEWAGAGAQSVTVPWRLIEGVEDARAFAAELSAAPIARIRGTSISSALTFAGGLFDGSGYQGLRRVVDVSGDGPNNMGPPVTPARDALTAEGIIVNGLPIMLHSSTGWMNIPHLDAYYRDCVIGGPAAFMVPVVAPDQLAEAIRRKLVLEIAGPAAAPSLIAETVPDEPADCLAGERQRRGWDWDR
jgi:hypothetical protein